LSVEIEIPVDSSMEMNSKIANMRRDDGIEGAVSDNNISYMQFESANEWEELEWVDLWENDLSVAKSP